MVGKEIVSGQHGSDLRDRVASDFLTYAMHGSEVVHSARERVLLSLRSPQLRVRQTR